MLPSTKKLNDCYSLTIFFNCLFYLTAKVRTGVCGYKRGEELKTVSRVTVNIQHITLALFLNEGVIAEVVHNVEFWASLRIFLY